jgi:hypothetical protein
MAKKKAAKAALEQQRIPGAQDEPSKKLKSLGRQYAKILRERQALQIEEAEKREQCRELMKEEDVMLFEVDRETLWLEAGEAKLKCTKVKDEE